MSEYCPKWICYNELSLVIDQWIFTTMCLFKVHLASFVTYFLILMRTSVIGRPLVICITHIVFLSDNEDIEILEPDPELCKVCGERAGKHNYYGGQVCPSCRAFFRRAVQSKVYEGFACLKGCSR